jgi:hypothetical protein
MADMISLLESLFTTAVLIAYILYPIDPKNPKMSKRKIGFMLYRMDGFIGEVAKTPFAAGNQ